MYKNLFGRQIDKPSTPGICRDTGFSAIFLARIDDIFIGEEGSNLGFSETATTIPIAPVTTAVPEPGCGNRQNIF